MEPRTIFVDLKAKSAQQINHVIAAALLIVTAGDSLSRGHHPMWAAVELFVALILIVFIGREFWRKKTSLLRETIHDHVGWVEIVTGLFLGIEACSKTRGPHHVSFVVLNFIPPFLLVFLGLIEPRLARRFFLRTDEDAFEARLSRRTRFRVPWSEIRSVSRDGSAFHFSLTDGTTKEIATRKLIRSDLVQAWMTQRLEERALHVHPRS